MRGARCVADVHNLAQPLRSRPPAATSHQSEVPQTEHSRVRSYRSIERFTKRFAAHDLHRSFHGEQACARLKANHADLLLRITPDEGCFHRSVSVIQSGTWGAGYDFIARIGVRSVFWGRSRVPLLRKLRIAKLRHGKFGLFEHCCPRRSLRRRSATAAIFASRAQSNFPPARAPIVAAHALANFRVELAYSSSRKSCQDRPKATSTFRRAHKFG
jgi:hypothetical protein